MQKEKMLRIMLFLSPAILFLAVMVIFPIFSVIRLSFFRHDLLKRTTFFLGFDNFVELFTHDPIFWVAVKNTFFFTFFTSFIQFMAGMAIALLLSEEFKGRAIFRALVLIVWAVPFVICAQVWKLLLSEDLGVINYFLTVLHIIKKPIPWLRSESLALISVSISLLWKGIPFSTVILLCNLQAVPNVLHEAARIDGASYLQRVIHVTLPIIKSGMLILSSLLIIFNFIHFDTIYTLTRGGPGYASEVLSTYIYNTTFTSLTFGYGSSIAVIMLMILSVMIFFYIRLWIK